MTGTHMPMMRENYTNLHHIYLWSQTVAFSYLFYWGLYLLYTQYVNLIGFGTHMVSIRRRNQIWRQAEIQFKYPLLTSFSIYGFISQSPVSTETVSIDLLVVSTKLILMHLWRRSQSEQLPRSQSAARKAPKLFRTSPPPPARPPLMMSPSPAEPDAVPRDGRMEMGAASHYTPLSFCSNLEPC